MNNPFQVQAPANEPTATSMKLKTTREAEKQRNREIGHLVKTASQHRPMITRSVPHSRGR